LRRVLPVSAASFVRFLATISPTELSCQSTFSVADFAATPALSSRLDLVAGFPLYAAAVAYSALVARTDDGASCSGIGFIAFAPSKAVEVSSKY
jgi:hypothetical protein